MSRTSGCDPRAVQLDRAHHLLVRERARRELHVEPLCSRACARCRRSCAPRSRASRRTARPPGRRRAGSACGCTAASRARGRSCCSSTRSPRTPLPTPADRSRRCGRASARRPAAARGSNESQRAVVEVDERAEAGGGAADDREHEAVAVAGGADDGLGRSADSDPRLETVLGLREDVASVERRAQSSPARSPASRSSSCENRSSFSSKSTS